MRKPFLHRARPVRRDASAVAPSCPAAAEALERRVLLAVVPAGPEITVATGVDLIDYVSVAADADGDFVAVWEEKDPGDVRNVYARLYDAAGSPRGPVFRVNSTTDAVSTRHPRVAMDDDGDFAIAWHRRNLVLNRTEVVVHRYGADGASRGGEFVVAGAGVWTAFYQPTVAMDDDGDFVVTYLHGETDPGTRLETVWMAGRAFDADGTQRGGEFRVAADGDYSTNGASPTQVAMDSDGDFIVAWANQYVRGNERVRIRRFDRGGAPRGDVTVVSAEETPAHGLGLAADADGAFVVSWSTGQSVFARRYGADGVSRDEAFRVNYALTDSYGNDTSVGMDDAGNFVITWDEFGPTPAWWGVNARRYDASGAADGAPFVVSPTSTQDQSFAQAADVAVAGDGSFVVAYERLDQAGDIDARSVRARLFNGDPAPPAAAVTARHAFYNRSSFDGNDAAANPADDGAIATDKAALLAGQTASFANVTSYDKGINGVMLDVQGLPVGTNVLSASDFIFRAGAGGDPASWVEAPVPAQIAVRRSAIPEQPARVTLVWPDGAIRNQWLQVTVKANANTGLSSPDRFSFGNLVGETGDDAGPLRVSAADLLAVRRNLFSSSPVTGRHDFDRDGRVSVRDWVAVRANQLHSLTPPTAPSATQAVPMLASTALPDRRTRTRRGAYELLA